MDDRGAIEAFIDGARSASGPTIHIEEDALLLSGWWHFSVRIGDESFLVRTEEAPDDSGIVDDLAEALQVRGIQRLPGEHPLILAVIYTEVSTAGGDWTLWSTDEQRGKNALLARAGMETVVRGWEDSDSFVVEGMDVQLEGARRIAGLPPSVILTVGLERTVVYGLEAAIPEARFEWRSLEEIAPEACGELGPTVILVDARERKGREFIMELRAAACGRFLPVAAVVADGPLPAGADVALDAAQPAPAWRGALVGLLP
ncbi:MAG: hypothetical protein ACR2L3_02575 [Actinomycetota bacterium]